MKHYFIQGCWFIALVVLLSACGSTAQSQEATEPDLLHITRVLTVPGYHLPPLDVEIHNEARVRELYQAANALQPVPKGEVLHCPNDIGVQYHLTFASENGFDQAMDLDASGCQLLDLNAAGYDIFGIIDIHDVRFTTPAFRALLAKALGMQSLWPSEGHQ